MVHRRHPGRPPRAPTDALAAQSPRLHRPPRLRDDAHQTIRRPIGDLALVLGRRLGNHPRIDSSARARLALLVDRAPRRRHCPDPRGRTRRRTVEGNARGRQPEAVHGRADHQWSVGTGDGGVVPVDGTAAMRFYLTTYRPLCGTPFGRDAATRHGLPPFIDGSCRREPDFQSRFPTITALCRAGKFAPRLQVHDHVAYITAGSWHLTAILEVIKKLTSHAAAAEWF